MPKDRTANTASSDHDIVSPNTCSMKIMDCENREGSSPHDGDEKEWEEARCPICLEHPHNAVLLVCSSKDKGCRPFICDTSYRHSNCFDQFRKSFAASFGLQTPNENQKPNIVCPLCRGLITGWNVVEPARKFMNSKTRSCSLETCDFRGDYVELRKHARVEHASKRPTEVSPTRRSSWTIMEQQREFEDAFAHQSGIVIDFDSDGLPDWVMSDLDSWGGDGFWTEAGFQNFFNGLTDIEDDDRFSGPSSSFRTPSSWDAADFGISSSSGIFSSLSPSTDSDLWSNDGRRYPLQSSRSRTGYHDRAYGSRSRSGYPRANDRVNPSSRSSNHRRERSTFNNQRESTRTRRRSSFHSEDGPTNPVLGSDYDRENNRTSSRSMASFRLLESSRPSTSRSSNHSDRARSRIRSRSRSGSTFRRENVSTSRPSYSREIAPERLRRLTSSTRDDLSRLTFRSTARFIHGEVIRHRRQNTSRQSHNYSRRP